MLYDASKAKSRAYCHIDHVIRCVEIERLQNHRLSCCGSRLFCPDYVKEAKNVACRGKYDWKLEKS